MRFSGACGRVRSLGSGNKCAVCDGSICVSLPLGPTMPLGPCSLADRGELVAAGIDQRHDVLARLQLLQFDGPVKRRFTLVELALGLGQLLALGDRLQHLLGDVLFGAAAWQHAEHRQSGAEPALILDRLPQILGRHRLADAGHVLGRRHQRFGERALLDAELRNVGEALHIRRQQAGGALQDASQAIAQAHLWLEARIGRGLDGCHLAHQILPDDLLLAVRQPHFVARLALRNDLHLGAIVGVTGSVMVSVWAPCVAPCAAERVPLTAPFCIALARVSRLTPFSASRAP